MYFFVVAMFRTQIENYVQIAERKCERDRELGIITSNVQINVAWNIKLHDVLLKINVKSLY